MVEFKIKSVIVPGWCTDQLQPLDNSVNKSAKSFMQSAFQKWYFDEVAEQLRSVDIDDVKVDLMTARMKCIRARWIVQLFEYCVPTNYSVLHKIMCIHHNILVP